MLPGTFIPRCFHRGRFLRKHGSKCVALCSNSLSLHFPIDPETQEGKERGRDRETEKERLRERERGECIWEWENQ